MKNNRHGKKCDPIDNRMDISNHQVGVPKSKLSAISVVDKFPVLLDVGRTIVFISDKSKES